MALLNIPDMNISEVKEHLKHYYKNIIINGSFKKARSVFLWSLPGIGKSSVVRQIASELTGEMKVPVEVREIRLGECTIFELLGIMTKNTNTNEMEYMEPPIYKATDDPEGIVLLLLDELDKASGQLQAAALHLVLDHCYWTFSLPERCIVIGAGNPENIDGKCFSKFAPELNNRFRHYSIVPHYDAWNAWAVSNNISPLVIQFLSRHYDYLYQMEKDGEEDTAFPTPRSWVAVSDYLGSFSETEIDYDWMYPDICGEVGAPAALAFVTFCKKDIDFPEIEEIFLGKYVKVPAKADSKYALINSMLAYAKENKDKINTDCWENACRFINAFPEDYAALFYSSMMSIGRHHSAMLFCKAYRQWTRKHGSLLAEQYNKLE